MFEDIFDEKSPSMNTIAHTKYVVREEIHRQSRGSLVVTRGKVDPNIIRSYNRIVLHYFL